MSIRLPDPSGLCNDPVFRAWCDACTEGMAHVQQRHCAVGERCYWVMNMPPELLDELEEDPDNRPYTWDLPE